jgi:hypothetical protein
MKPKTDEEILEIKHKLEAKGFTWEKTKTDYEWIARYRYLNAPVKEKLKRSLLECKQWVIIHPRTAASYFFSLFFFVVLMLGAALMVRAGGEVMNSEIEIMLTFNQLAGIVFIIAGGFFMLLAYVVFRFVIYMTSGTFEDDEKAYKRKLRRDELKKQSTSPDSYNQTGNKGKE